MSTYPLTPCFTQFQKQISLNQGQKDQLKNAQISLIRKLRKDPQISPIIETAFIQGSYGRGTALCPRSGNISDIDIVVVTKLHLDEYTPEEALRLFRSFIRRHYDAGTYRTQTHSCGIRMQNTRIDVVPAISPHLMERGILGEHKWQSYIFSGGISTLARMNALRLAPIEDGGTGIPEWKRGILFIPNRDESNWQETDPLDIIRRTHSKNRKCYGNYTQVVKCLKWWRREKFPKQKYLKSYPLEWLVEKYCEDGIRNVEDGIISTLEGLADSKNYWLQINGCLGNFGTYNPFKNLTSEQVNDFFASVNEALEFVREAYYEENLQKASKQWRKVLGDKFPLYSELLFK